MVATVLSGSKLIWVMTTLRLVFKNVTYNSPTRSLVYNVMWSHIYIPGNYLFSGYRIIGTKRPFIYCCSFKYLDVMKTKTQSTFLHNHARHETRLFKKLSYVYLHDLDACILAWKNSRHLATLPLVSPLNDVWQTSAENSYWWRATIQIWVVLLIGRAAWEICFNQSEALPRSR